MSKGGSGSLPSNRDEDVEDTDHDAPLTPSKEVSYDCGSNSGVAGLANAY